MKANGFSYEVIFVNTEVPTTANYRRTEAENQIPCMASGSAVTMANRPAFTVVTPREGIRRCSHHNGCRFADSPLKYPELYRLDYRKNGYDLAVSGWKKETLRPTLKTIPQIY